MDNSIAPAQGFFYDQRNRLTRHSAQIILGIVFEFLKPKSVIDVGCGIGTWLEVCREHSIDDVLGIDADYVDAKELRVPQTCFRSADLTQPVCIGREFDLAISLEVAEHLPATSAESFIKLLTSLAPVILFSAAVPGQGGFRHVNEQWPSYWVSWFATFGYSVADIIRPRIWNDSSIPLWYRQNTLMLVRQDVVKNSTVWRQAVLATRVNQLDLAHPELLELRTQAVTPKQSSRIFRAFLSRWFLTPIRRLASRGKPNCLLT